MVAELRDVTKALLGYGARMPKELMLFVKDILFLNGAMATMAPDVDILGEILAVVTYFTERHGEQIAREVGVELLETPIDLDGYRAAMGFPDEDDPITFQDLQERRELIRRRLQDRAEPRSRRSFMRAVYRLIRPARSEPASSAPVGPCQSPEPTGHRRDLRVLAVSSRIARLSQDRQHRGRGEATIRTSPPRRGPLPPAAGAPGPSRPPPRRPPRRRPTACSGVDTPMPTQTGRSVWHRRSARPPGGPSRPARPARRSRPSGRRRRRSRGSGRQMAPMRPSGVEGATSSTVATSLGVGRPRPGPDLLERQVGDDRPAHAATRPSSPAIRSWPAR